MQAQELDDPGGCGHHDGAHGHALHVPQQEQAETGQEDQGAGEAVVMYLYFNFCL